MVTKSKQKQKAKAVQSAPARRSAVMQIVIAATVIATLLVIPLRRWYLEHEQKQKVMSIMSTLDFQGVEPQVQSKILELKNAVVTHPGSAEAWGKLAMNLDVHDFKKEAIESYKEAATLDGSNFRWPYFCALILFQNGSRESLTWFDRTVALRSDYPPLFVNHGDALLRFDRPEDATKKYGLALQLDSRNSHALLGLARISREKGDLQASKRDLEKAIEANPYHAEAYHLLAAVCRQQKDSNCTERATVNAAGLPEKTHMNDPVYAELTAEGVSSLWYSSRGSEYLKQGRYDAAISELQRALELRPDSQTQEDLAKAFNAAGRYADAEHQYRSIVDSHPTANNYFGLALASARQGSYDAAEDFFRKAIQQNSNFAEAYFNLAVVFAKRGRVQETIANLNEAIRIKPDYAEARYHLGLAYMAGMDISSARNQYSILLTLDPKLAGKLQQIIQNDQASKPGTE